MILHFKIFKFEYNFKKQYSLILNMSKERKQVEYSYTELENMHDEKSIINSQINISVNKLSTNRKKKECKRCGRTNHTTNSCFAEFDVNGEYIDSDLSSDDDHYNMRCFRCDRIGHFANECYARYDIRGYFIMD